MLVESLGADSYVHAAIEGTDTKFVARTEGYDARRPGSNVRLRIDPERIFGFDAESEERLGGGSTDAPGNGHLERPGHDADREDPAPAREAQA